MAKFLLDDAEMDNSDVAVLQVLNHNFRHNEYIGFPHPIFASRNVIIETFELGSIVSSYIENYQCKSNNVHDIIPLKYSKFIVTKVRFVIHMNNRLRVYLPRVCQVT